MHLRTHTLRMYKNKASMQFFSQLHKLSAGGAGTTTMSPMLTTCRTDERMEISFAKYTHKRKHIHIKLIVHAYIETKLEANGISAPENPVG